MKKKVTKFKINWPFVFAMILGATLVSCHNEHMQEKYQEEQIHQQQIEFENIVNSSTFDLKEPDLDQIEYPDNFGEVGTEDEAGFSK